MMNLKMKGIFVADDDDDEAGLGGPSKVTKKRKIKKVNGTTVTSGTPEKYSRFDSPAKENTIIVSIVESRAREVCICKIDTNDV